MNSSFDEQLRQALGRREAPHGFAERVMAKIPAKRRQNPYWYGAVAAGLALVFTFGGIEQNRREHRLRAQDTQRQVVFALSLAAEKLDHVNARLQKSAMTSKIDGDEGDRL